VNAGDRRRGDGDTRGGEATVEQDLGDGAAEGVANDDRWTLELDDDPLVVVDDPLDGECREWRGICVQRLDLGLHPRPARREHSIAGTLIALDPALPAARGEPEPVDQDDGVGCSSGSAHAEVVRSAIASDT
jgi:hypothetical protein